MTIFTRMCTSLDGFVTTPDDAPVQLAFDGWDAGALGFYELQERCAAVVMGAPGPARATPHKGSG
jgi:propanediol dehydratase large subunit